MKKKGREKMNDEEYERERVIFKKKLVHKLLKHIEKKKYVHKQISIKYKRIDDLTGAIITMFSAATLSSLILDHLSKSSAMKLASTILGSISTVGSAVKQASKITDKWADARTSYTQLSDLGREITIQLGKDHLKSDEIDTILSDVHHRLSLIESHESIVPGTELRFDVTEVRSPIRAAKSPTLYTRRMSEVTSELNLIPDLPVNMRPSV